VSDRHRGVPEGNAAWRARAVAAIPGGVSSPVRAFGSVGGQPYTVVGGEGAWVVDADGRRLLDMVQSYGAVLLGHAHPTVTEAITRAAAAGTSFGAPTPGEIELAERICAAVPGCAQVRLVSSGTEATMSAIRLARGATGRHRVVKFAGCYHGHVDALLAGGGSGVATLGLPGSAGVPPAAVADTVVVPYNQVLEIGPDVACVIVEPVAANMGLVQPAPGFLDGLRRSCDAAGALLVFDEVITGFRLSRGGAAETFGVVPDLWTFGKVLGGGLPIGAFGGSRELLAHLAPDGPVYQAGTLSGNPLATAAGAAVLDAMDHDGYRELTDRIGGFAAALGTAVTEGGCTAHVAVAGPLVGLLVGPPGAAIEAPADYDDVAAAVGRGAYPAFFHAMLRRGVALAPGAYEVLFPGTAHGERELALVVEAAGEASAEVAQVLAA